MRIARRWRGTRAPATKTWRAYLSVTDLNGKGAINARDRIGRGPWHNANGVRIAVDVDDLHSDSSNITADTAITEKGQKLPAEPNQHDILTGSTRDGRAWNYNLLDDLNLERGAMTCSNYTSDAEDQFVMVGHHDRAGTAPISPWNAAHPSIGCRQANGSSRRAAPGCSIASRSTERPLAEWLRRREFADNTGQTSPCWPAEVVMHHFIRAADIKPTPAFPKHSTGYRRFALSDRSVGAVHTGWGLCELDAGGRVDLHVQSFEKSFFVLSGNPALILDGRGYRLSAGACGLIPVGMKHAWLGPTSGTAKWIDMNAPCPKGENFADDTYFLGPPPAVAVEDFDIRDPSSRHLFRMAEDDIKVDSVRKGLKKDAAKVSASMATALLVYSGISLKMLVDQRLDAALHTMFMVEYEPNANAHPHDHPLEEAYYVTHGEVEAWADDAKYVMQPGDFLWAGVGCTHAFYNRSNGTVRWLETQSPQPPARNSYRWARDWEYVSQQLERKGVA